MNENLAMMKVRKMELTERQMSLRLKAKGLCRMIPPLINPMLTKIEKMAIAEAATAMDELVVVQAERLSLAQEISDLEEALGY